MDSRYSYYLCRMCNKKYSRTRLADGYVDTDGLFYYPEQLDFRNEGRIVGPNGETLNIQEVREHMITSLDNIIEKLRRNKSILQEGGVLENEHWADIAVAFREATYYFANQQFYKHEK